MRLIASLVIAFSTYSRIPMPRVQWTDANRKYALCWFPLIGAVAGALLWLWVKLSGLINAGAFLKGAVGALIPLIITGGIHIDGFMDTSDAMASWQPPERRLEILKDSHIGAFAAMKCAAYLLIEAALIGELNERLALMAGAAFVLSRALSAVLSITLKQARPGGMLDGFASSAAGKAVYASSAIYAALALGLMAFINPIGAGLTALACALVILYYRHMALKYFGGVTGDLAGWFLCVCELSAFLAIYTGGVIA